ncbi:MAG: calcium/sodium antiporter [Romboutsia sp.]
MNYIFLAVGFVLLVKGADIFVDGTSNIARLFKIPPLIIGLTIVAFGTSAPEAAVSITASLNGQNGMAIGNVIGSNTFNLLMVIGAAGFIKNLDVGKFILYKELPFVLAASALMLLLSLDFSLGYFDGFILLSSFILFLYYLLHTSLKFRGNYLSINETYIAIDSDVLTLERNVSTIKSIFLSFVGIISIIYGGKMVVNYASAIASTFGVSDQLISITIVAIGTSLPEFITSLVAATKGESALALGSVIGSNMFNILFVLGASAFMSPMPIGPRLIADAIFMIIATVIVSLFAYIKNDISKYESLILMGLYIFYIISLINTVY